MKENKNDIAMEAGQGKVIQWFPGHMARTRRKIKECLPQIDLVVEILDARAPLSSHNPDLDTIVAGKPRLVVLNKADMADESATARWVAYYRAHGIVALALDCKSGRGVNALVPAMRTVLADKIAAWKEKGMVSRPIRAMVVGIPNAGKSSFINRLARGGKAKVEDRPGVTRDNRWFTVEAGALLLDTPGVLWPKFEDPQVARRLAYTGAIRDEILDGEELACFLLQLLDTEYRPLLSARYRLSEEELDACMGDGWELLCLVGKKRGMLVSGGEVNTERAAAMLLDEFRAAKIGRITLEMPPCSDNEE